MDVLSSARRYVCDDRHRLRLFDLVGNESRRVAELFRSDPFSVAAHPSNDDFRTRVAAYEEAVANLCRVEALVSSWGGGNITETLTLPLRRLSDDLDGGSGSVVLLGLRSYPVHLLAYAAGIAAVHAGRFELLRSMLHVPVRTSGEEQLLVAALPRGMSRAGDAFRLLPGLDRNYTPVSDRLFEVLRPVLDELLFLGSDYERAFDRFEVLLAIEQIHQIGRIATGGRFEWKHSPSPVVSLTEEVSNADDRWPAVAAGLCGGSMEKFRAAADQLKNVVSKRGRW